jgi:hypothetical protein
MSDAAFLNGVSVKPAPGIRLHALIIAYYDPIGQSRRHAAISLSLMRSAIPTLASRLLLLLK